MQFFPFLHLFTALIYLWLAGFALNKNYKSDANRFFSITQLSFALWAFTLIFLHNTETSKKVAILALHISAPSWIGFSSFFLCFMLAFSGKSHFFKKKWLMAIIFGIPLVLVYTQLTGDLIPGVTRVSYGWKPYYSDSIVPYIYYIYYFTFVSIGIFINFSYLKNTDDPMRKKQARLAIITISIALVLGTITDMLLPLMGIHTIPNIAANLILIWALGVAYAIAKYKFMVITPALAAENIISTLFDCLVLSDMEGTIVRVNQATVSCSGYLEKELVGQPIDTLFRLDHSQVDGVEENQGSEPSSSLILAHQEGKNRDLTLRSKDGRDIPVLFSSSLLKSEHGLPAGYVCVARNIMERRKLEEEVIKSKKLESIGVLAGGIAHDFNNLLSVIIGHIALARQNLSSSHKAFPLLNNAEESAVMAGELTKKLITFSKGGWMKSDKIVLADLLRDLKLPVPLDAGGHEINQATEKCQLVYHVAPGLVPIRGDREQIRQVLQALLLNAVEAVPDIRMGKIEISGTLCDASEAKQFDLKERQYVKIMVQDNGRGIKPDYIEKVFDPYFSTKDLSSQKGMGLGLTICYSIIKKHHGHINLESEKDKGTRVSIYLPAYG